MTPLRSGTGEDTPRAAARGIAVRELPRQEAWRLFLLAIPAEALAARRERSIAALGLPPALPGQPGPGAARRRRLVEAAAADARDGLMQEVAGALMASLGLRPEVPPRLEILAEPPGGDLVLRLGVLETPVLEVPDPAGLRLARPALVPGPADIEAELAAMAEAAATWQEQPPGTPAAPGDILVCDILATLEPQASRIPQPGVLGAAAGQPGCLPEGWAFGDNGAGLATEVRAVVATADPPHIRLRVYGTPRAEGQSYLAFHGHRDIPAKPGSVWSASVDLRPVGRPLGLRGGKLRLFSRGAAEQPLQRKDSALGGAIAPEPGGFGRVQVANSFGAPGTAWLVMVLLFDHAAGPVDFTFEIGAPRLVEGLDLAQDDPTPLPRFSGAGLRLAVGRPGGGAEPGTVPDPLGLGMLAEGLRPAEVRMRSLRLPEGLGDLGLAGRSALVQVTAAAVLRRVIPSQAALAEGLGLADAVALRAAARALAAGRLAARAEARLRADVLDWLDSIAAGLVLPAPLVAAELAAIWPGLVAAGAPPTGEAAAVVARRSLRRRLATEALARRLGLPIEPPPAGETPEAALARRAGLEARVLAAALARAEFQDLHAQPEPARHHAR